MRVEAGGNAALPRERRRGRLALVAALIAAGASAGCANPFSPEGDDVGVYKGEHDPFMEEPASDRRDALRERFEIIQSR